jgi:alcohol dehydrogenase (cytochrome c)
VEGLIVLKLSTTSLVTSLFCCGLAIALSACSSSGSGNPGSTVDGGDGGGSGGAPSTTPPLKDSGTEPDGKAHADAEAGPSRPKGAPPEVTQYAKDWPLANRDYQATRATVDSTISKANVRKLAEAWKFELPGGSDYGAAVAAPIVLGDTVYYEDSASDVYAIDFATGAQKWQKKYNGPSPGPNGIAVGWGKVFATSSDHSFVALDIATGKELWKSPLTIPKSGGLDVQPVAYDGLVYIGTVPVNSNGAYTGGTAGILYALDEETGAVVWQFDTVDSKDIWGNATVNSGGGSWYPPTVDVTTGMVFFGTGNAAPYPGTAAFPNGSSRPGANLYSSSVVALGADDGKLAWYYQDTPHNLFDLDFQCPPIIVSATIDGGAHHVVIGSGKTGSVVALDETTGKRLWRTLVGKHQNDDAQEVPDAGLEVFPGSLGGVETPPAYADGVIYVPVVNLGTAYTPSAGTPDQTGTGELVALDVTTGKPIWDKTDLPNLAIGAATVVNDVVLTTTFDGTLFAVDRATGKQLFSYLAPAGINAPLSVVGDTVLVPAGTGLGVPYLVALRPTNNDAGPLPEAGAPDASSDAGSDAAHAH